MTIKTDQFAACPNCGASDDGTGWIMHTAACHSIAETRRNEMTMPDQKLKLFHVTDYETFAAYNAQQALELWQKEFGPDRETTIKNVRQVSKKELDIEYPELDKNEEETGKITTMRRQLGEMTEPGIFWQVV